MPSRPEIYLLNRHVYLIIFNNLIIFYNICNYQLLSVNGFVFFIDGVAVKPAIAQAVVKLEKLSYGVSVELTDPYRLWRSGKTVYSLIGRRRRAALVNVMVNVSLNP